MSKKKILMQRFNGTGYDPQYPETHVKNVTGINQTVANNVGVATTDGATVIGEMSEIDYFVSPQGTTTGTSTAYNLNIGSQYTSLDDMDGVVIRAKFHTTTGDNPTLNVNGLGAKPILAENGANIPYQIGENVWATLIWSSTLNGWIVQGWGKKRVFHKEIITKTTNWTVPEGIEGGIVNVMLFGGGGGGAADGVGGGGNVATKTITVVPRTIYPITVGAGGSGGASRYANGNNGGVSSFGTLVSANGGNGGTSGNSSGSPSIIGSGGNGGSGGGSGGKDDLYAVTPGTPGSGSYGGNGGNGSTRTTSAQNGGSGIEAAGGTGTGGSKGTGSGAGGGGGGGYGGKGGNGGNNSSSGGGGGGGGGGYGASGNGGNGGTALSGVAGENGGIGAGGGGAGSNNGGSGSKGGKGGNGICILTYWAWE